MASNYKVIVDYTPEYLFEAATPYGDSSVIGKETVEDALEALAQDEFMDNVFAFPEGSVLVPSYTTEAIQRAPRLPASWTVARVLEPEAPKPKKMVRVPAIGLPVIYYMAGVQVSPVACAAIITGVYEPGSPTSPVDLAVFAPGGWNATLHPVGIRKAAHPFEPVTWDWPPYVPDVVVDDD